MSRATRLIQASEQRGILTTLLKSVAIRIWKPRSSSNTTSLNDHSLPTTPDLEVMLAEYQSLRDDDRTAGTIQASLISIAALFLGAVSTLAAQSCQFQGERPGPRCTDVPPLLLATLPLAPLAAMSYSIMIGGTSTVRYYYLRHLEAELQRNGTTIDLDGVSLRHPAYLQISRELVSLRAGKMSYRALMWFITGSVLLAFGGFIYIGVWSISNTVIRGIAAAGYLLSIAFLTREVFRYSIGGRRLWEDILEALNPSSETSRDQHRNRSMIMYVLLPRPADILVKSWFIVMALILGAVAAGAATKNWLNPVLFITVFEYLIYQARYQWNDIRGFAEDQEHPSSSDRGRLPGPVSKARSHIMVSLVFMIIRLLLAAYITLAVFPRTKQDAMLASSILVFAVGISYEYVRSTSKHRTDTFNCRWANPWILAVCLIVGLGYPLRVVTGLWIGSAGTIPLVVACAALICMWAFGCMFVMMTWSLEATSFVSDSESTKEMARRKPHVTALGGFLMDNRFLSKRPSGFKALPSQPLLCLSNRACAPWNAAFIVGVGTSPVIALSLSDKLVVPPPLPTLLLIVIEVLLGILVVQPATGSKYAAIGEAIHMLGEPTGRAFPSKTQCSEDRSKPGGVWIWRLRMVASLVIVAAPITLSNTLSLPKPWLALFPSAVIVVVYWLFLYSSYDSLTKGLGRFQKQIVSGGRKLTIGTMKRFFGDETLSVVLGKGMAKLKGDE